MKERPILYSTPMAKAKRARIKTHTRRIIKESFNGCLTNGGPHPCPNAPIVIHPGEVYESPCNPGEIITVHHEEVRAIFHCSTLDAVAKCRYGKIGDILWGRETWAKYTSSDCVGGVTTRYRYKAEYKDECYQWKPSIHMPKIAAQLWDRITNIQVERLQDITEYDARCEGHDILIHGEDSIAWYKKLWESINGPGSWELNPWVWVIESEILSTTGRPDNL